MPATLLATRRFLPANLPATAPVDPVEQLVLDLMLRLVEELMTHGLSVGELEDISQMAFVQVARELNTDERGKANISTIAIATGLSRQEVARTLSRADSFVPKLRRTNRAKRVLLSWQTDTTYNPTQGATPPAVPFSGAKSFTTLVKAHSGDIPVVAMEKFMVGAGMVRVEGHGPLRRVVPQARYLENTDDTDREELKAKLLALIDELDR